jgi:hypothetical protein
VNYRLIQTTVLCALLMLLHCTVADVFPVTNQPVTNQIVHTYVPPLTHAPGLGMSMLGMHETPPFTILDSLHSHLSQAQRKDVNHLHQDHRRLLTAGVAHRIRMQNLTVQLTEQVSEGLIHQAWLNRLNNEKRIGEIRVWNRLIEQHSASRTSNTTVP